MEEEKENWLFDVSQAEDLTIAEVFKELNYSLVRLIVSFLMLIALGILFYGVVFDGYEFSTLTTAFFVLWGIVYTTGDFLTTLNKRKILKQAEHLYYFVENSELEPKEAVEDFYRQLRELEESEDEE